MRMSNRAVLDAYRRAAEQGRRHALKRCRTVVLERIRHAGGSRNKGPADFELGRLSLADLLSGLTGQSEHWRTGRPWPDRCADELLARMPRQLAAA